MSTISQHTAAVEAFNRVVPTDEKIVYLASVGDMSIYHYDAQVIPVPRALALRYLAKKTHRLATPEEKKAYDDTAHKAKVDSDNARQLPISAETIAQVAHAVMTKHTANTNAAAPENKKGKGSE